MRRGPLQLFRGFDGLTVIPRWDLVAGYTTVASCSAVPYQLRHSPHKRWLGNTMCGTACFGWLASSYIPAAHWRCPVRQQLLSGCLEAAGSRILQLDAPCCDWPAPSNRRRTGVFRLVTANPPTALELQGVAFYSPAQLSPFNPLAHAVTLIYTQPTPTARLQHIVLVVGRSFWVRPARGPRARPIGL